MSLQPPQGGVCVKMVLKLAKPEKSIAADVGGSSPPSGKVTSPFPHHYSIELFWNGGVRMSERPPLRPCFIPHPSRKRSLPISHSRFSFKSVSIDSISLIQWERYASTPLSQSTLTQLGLDYQRVQPATGSIESRGWEREGWRCQTRSWTEGSPTVCSCSS
jgi:hypothetical protein